MSRTASATTTPDTSLPPDLPSLDRIREVAEDLYSAGIRRTEVHRWRVPVRMARHTVRIVDVLVKDETAQVTGSYKARGAMAAVRHAVRHEQAHRVFTVSTGNFAAGVGFACAWVGVPGVAFVPRCAPVAKVQRVRAAGLEVRLAGDSFDDAMRIAHEQALLEPGAALVHPYDHPATVAGQATLALELHEQCGGEYDTLAVQLGGGGLFAGCAQVHATVAPRVALVGVVAESSPAFLDSAARWRPCTVPVRAGRDGTVLADGMAVGAPGRLGWAALAALGREVVSVADASIRSAMRFAEGYQLFPEGAGAVGLAALLAGRLPGGRVAIVLTGGSR